MELTWSTCSWRLGATIAAVLALAACGSEPTASDPSPDTGEQRAAPNAEAQHPEAMEATRHFLDSYVEDDGRVTRTEGDTVSEGQAYGLLLTVAIGDQARFERIWRWTRQHLQRPDQLLAWRWADGEVVSELVAPDADLDAARALVLAADRFDEDDYAEQGLGIADALLEHATVHHQAGLVLTAGDWASGADRPVINPSYFSPRAFEVLGRASGDERWSEVAASSRAVVDRLLDEGAGVMLPPDWAVLAEDTITPSTAPAEEEGPAFYGLDAARVPIRFAASCATEDREVAARLWPVLSELRADRLRTHHYLGGRVSAEESHPLSHVAAAGAARAAGQQATTDDLLDEAQIIYEDAPTYYGAAWVALGRVKLQTDLLGRC
jgi:endoglucanase